MAEAKGEADIIVANIIADIIIRLTPSTIAHLKGPKVFISSGIIDTRAHEVEAALEKNGLKIIKRTEQNGWVSLRAKKV